MILFQKHVNNFFNIFTNHDLKKKVFNISSLKYFVWGIDEIKSITLPRKKRFHCKHILHFFIFKIKIVCINMFQSKKNICY